VVWLSPRCHGHFSFSKSLKPPEIFFELSFAGRWIAATVLSGLRLRLGRESLLLRPPWFPLSLLLLPPVFCLLLPRMVLYLALALSSSSA
jgi:hypothetical protein